MLSSFAALSDLIVFAQDEPFIGSTLFFVIMVVLLLVLGGVLFYLRSKRPED